MSAPIFAAALTTTRMINRSEELAKLEKAICQHGDETRVVIIEGAGGLGKTRLLSETLWLSGNPNIFPYRSNPDPEEAWDIQDRVIVSDLLDFTEVRLHNFDHFVQVLCQGFSWNEHTEFINYDAAIAYYRRKRKDLASILAIEEAVEEANKAFFEDYERLAGQFRLVWALDTAEQLTYAGAPWLVGKKLLTPNDLNFSTQQRILELLTAGELPNTTILLVGRPEAGLYFDQIKVAANRVNSNFDVITVQLNVFDPTDLKTYLSQLAQDYQAHPDFDDQIVEQLQVMAEDEDRIKALWLYTGGQPVRLALFVDALVEGKQEPEALQDTFEEAKKRVKWDDIKNEPDAEALKSTQFDIEEEFINLIFSKTTDLRSRILTALVRARRGLDEERLHFILGSLPGANIGEWEGDPALRKEIEKVMDPKNPYSVRRLSFVKAGAGDRLILQDELYRIYDEHMARDEISRQDEAEARLKLYQQLQSFAQWEIDKLKEIRNKNRFEDEKSLRWESPARALSMTFRYLGEEEEDERISLEEQILESELERMHYGLRIAPDEAFNDAFYDLAERRWRAAILEADTLVQIELWRFLRDEYARKFIDLKPRKSRVPDSTPWQALERAAEEDDVARWIKRFFLRGDYKRAVQFSDQVETTIEKLPEPVRLTLSHTFSRGERTCWRELANSYLSSDIPETIDNLRNAAKQLERLLSGGFPERGEFDFRDHPAEIRLRRVIGVTYNNLGYALVAQGYYRQAVQAYTEGLRHLRDTSLLAQEAVTRNNLSRAISELGLIARAVRICRDGLELRKDLGAENQIAVSYSTLALIYNNGLQPENAWREAAKAVVYFRKLGNERGLGLALTHLGEALRRLASSKRSQADTSEQLFEAAMNAMAEAVQIFDQSPEIMRRIEAAIEQGCLYRDYMAYIKNDKDTAQKERFKQRKNRAINILKKALRLAKQHNFPRHQLDAQVNLAWTYYYAEETEAAEKAIEDALTLVPVNCFLKKNHPPPNPEVAEPYTFMQLGKVWTVRGCLRLERFKETGDGIIATFEKKRAGRLAVRDDPEASRLLKEGVEAFELALAYNKLYSIRSAAISVTLDIFYAYLKTLNAIALEDVYNYQQQVRNEYRVAEIKPEDVTDSELFLLQSFGDFFAPAPSSLEVG